MTLESKNIHSDAYIVAIIIIAISIPLSKFTMSISEFILFGLWIWSGFHFRIAKRFFKYQGFWGGSYYFFGYIFKLTYSNFVEKMKLFFKNKAALVLASIYFLHIAGLITTNNFDYAAKDLRVKLPLLLFPVIFSTINKVNYKTFRQIMQFYIAAIFAGTLISAALFFKGDYYDIREISPFISPIRFGLNITFAIFILLYFIVKDKFFKKSIKIFFGVLIAWFIEILFLMQSLTALSAIFILIVGFLIYFGFKTRFLYFRLIIASLLIAFPIGIAYYIYHDVKQSITPPKINPATLDKYTAQGNPYIFDTIPPVVEDGKYIGLYICYKEMKKAWNKRSHSSFDGKTKTGENIKDVLIRYLTSKNLRKDAKGVNALTKKDIVMIENGVANYNYIANPGLHTRLLIIIKGYNNYEITGDPSGNSIMQRVEYLKAALHIIHDNFWIGVGTGDIEDAFYSEFNKMHSKLKEIFWFHAHNQFLAFFVAFGLFGFLFFLFALIYPVIITRAYHDYFFIVFYVIALFSMLTDDTLETQAGVTFFAFFFSFLMFGKKPKKKTLTHTSKL